MATISLWIWTIVLNKEIIFLTTVNFILNFSLLFTYRLESKGMLLYAFNSKTVFFYLQQNPKKYFLCLPKEATVFSNESRCLV